MSSWQYVFMFPDHGDSLQVEKVVRIFADSGFNFDSYIYPAHVVDEAGHLEHIDAINIPFPPIDEIEKLLRHNEQFLVECRNQELFLSISFAEKYYTNPHVMIGWPRTIFSALAKDSQEKYLRLIRNVANACGAFYIIIVNDPPDYFEDRFLEIDGQRFLDEYLPSGNKYDIQNVWINSASSNTQLGGVEISGCVDVGEGFQQHSIK